MHADRSEAGLGDKRCRRIKELFAALTPSRLAGRAGRGPRRRLRFRYILPPHVWSRPHFRPP
ncbi:MAG: hypothetical protein E6531_40355, partial [Bradyrhizobium sp.]|nr:hypothetical protein [Bradyrhizobium sp.]